MRFVAATTTIVARESSVPLALAITLLENHPCFGDATHQLMRKAVATDGTALLPASARVHAEGRATSAMLRVPLYAMHQSRNESSNPLGIDLLWRGIGWLENSVEESSEIQTLRLLGWNVSERLLL